MILITLSIVLLLLFCILVWLVVSAKTSALDADISKKMYQSRTTVKNQLMLFFTEIGKAPFVILVGALLLVFFNDEAIFPMVAAISSALSVVISYVLKKIIGRPRPNESRLVHEPDHSFPSAHALAAATLYGSILIHFTAENGLLTLLVQLLCVILIFSIGFSRVYLGIHYFTDILGGWMLGFMLVFSVTYFLTV